LIVPHKELDNETLTNLIESIVLREGTDYGDIELSLEEKVLLVKQQLQDGIALIEYSEEHESVNIISANDVTGQSDF
jgi:uncharacterized protein YheU (UPF0270 family)